MLDSSSASRQLWAGDVLSLTLGSSGSIAQQWVKAECSIAKSQLFHQMFPQESEDYSENDNDGIIFFTFIFPVTDKKEATHTGQTQQRR